jgi:hypothetical protein
VQILAHSIELFKDSGAGSKKKYSVTSLSLPSTSFYAHHPSGSSGTVSFMTRAVVNKILIEGSVNMCYAERCSVS